MHERGYLQPETGIGVNAVGLTGAPEEELSVIRNYVRRK
jgi:hypothetical protein